MLVWEIFVSVYRAWAEFKHDNIYIYERTK